MGGCWPTSGALSALSGALLAVLAGSAVPFLAPLVGAFAVVVGLTLIVFAFRLRERGRRMPTPVLAVLRTSKCASPSRGGYPLGEMRPWGMTHHRAWAYAPGRHAEREQTRKQTEVTLRWIATPP
jgi:hypothetical protein